MPAGVQVQTPALDLPPSLQLTDVEVVWEGKGEEGACLQISVQAESDHRNGFLR
eukprot:CAMPEP_0119325942 /NCGR_PEP_ID=MMETSP1333-20130426/67076_1 /TAXON_ID=418940 /ORGANISM="Scyphosphaera apsteinii, Strain RCC1455" /LENGTH=53 /DNA_ID=CAMNT_0007334097 /DNA_START=330 /DNA_END=487 /DNA_ORIENTATION=+